MDMVIFLLMFVTFMGERQAHVALYALSQLHLNELFGLANTLILLSSSWMMAEAVQASRRMASEHVSRYLAAAFLLGLAFVVTKAVEYALKFSAGITPATNSFYSFYFFITIVHFLHVLVGMACMAYCRAHARTGVGTSQYQLGLENVGLFWHFVDVLWIFIFPMLYLLGRQ
jgi:nitric oxide reductase NorE protein